MEEVSTVDAFQGAERDIVVLSCVRTAHVGFTDAPRRLNVALTRAQRHLIIAGHAAHLRNKSVLWQRIIAACASHGGKQLSEVFLRYNSCRYMDRIGV